MASLTIRKLDDEVKKRLRLRAASHGHSMEQEAREILSHGVGEAERDPSPHQPNNEPVGLGEAIRRRFAPLGGMELDIPPRGPLREPPKFDE